jgi:hypothetical protein
MRWRAWIFVPIATGCGVGCSLLYSADPLTSGPRSEPPEEGGSDAEAGGDAAACDPSFLFCDGFEETLDAWTPDTLNDGSVAIDPSRAHHGASSLHARLPADTLDIRAEVFPTQSPSWGRPVYFRFFLLLTSAHQSFLPVFLLEEPAPSPSKLFLSAQYAPYLDLDAQSTPDGGQSGNVTQISVNSWVCVEIEVDGANATLWVNGAARPVTSVSFAEPTENLRMTLGTRANGGATDPAYDAWFDDVAVANAQIGCVR